MKIDFTVPVDEFEDFCERVHAIWSEYEDYDYQKAELGLVRSLLAWRHRGYAGLIGKFDEPVCDGVVYLKLMWG